MYTEPNIEYGLRLQSRHGYLDLIIVTDPMKVVYLYTPEDFRFMFMPKDSQLPAYLSEQTAGMPTNSFGD